MSHLWGGATCIASLLSNRQYIGVELDENYFKISEERIKKSVGRKKKRKKIYKQELFISGRRNVTLAYNGWAYEKVCLDELSNYRQC